MKKTKYRNNLLGSFASAINMQIEQEIAGLNGRSLSHESALVVIDNHPGESIDRLSKVLGLSHSGAVRLINSLEAEQWVERRPSPEDARAVVLVTTPSGKKRVRALLEARERVTQKVLASLDESQQEALLPLLEQVLASLSGDAISARRICKLCDEQTCRPQGCPVEQAIHR